MDLAAYLRDVPDFPKPGILFKDISPLLSDPLALDYAVAQMAELDWGRITRIAGIESRGFLFGVPLALRLGLGFTPIRKPGKLPWKTHSEEYDLEYGTDILEIHHDGAADGDRVLIVDDVLATGGTMAAAARLVERAGAEVAGCLCLLELKHLEGRLALPNRDFRALIEVH